MHALAALRQGDREQGKWMGGEMQGCVLRYRSLALA